MTRIGQRLADEATRRGWSHQEAGEHLGVSQATFSRWCSGDNIPAAKHWTGIGRFLKIRREEVVDLVAAERAGRGTRGQAERLDELERAVADLREVMLRIADRLGLAP